jgi:hypothetical protein
MASAIRAENGDFAWIFREKTLACIFGFESDIELSMLTLPVDASKNELGSW